MIDRGSGIPVVLIPGIQGRWEWMAPAVDRLAEHCRVITFSLADEPTSGFACDEGTGLAAYVRQIEEALDRAQVDKAVIVGVSFSGLIAAEFATRHPGRVLGLVLSSALPPGWTPDRRVRFYLRAPRLLSPLFWVSSPVRMLPELVAALRLVAWPSFLWRLAANSLRASLSPTRMARRVNWLATFDVHDVSAIRVPVLLITGDDKLDRVVKPTLTREYLTLIPHAKHVTLPSTGHLGLVTKPGDFAEAVCRFAREAADSDATRLSA